MIKIIIYSLLFSNVLTATAWHQRPPAVIYTCHANGDFGATFVSKNVQSITGYNASDYLTNASFWTDRIHREDREQVLANLRNLSTLNHCVNEYRFRHHSGSYRWMQDEIQVLRDAVGRPTEMIGFWIDITERKQAEEDRFKLEKQLLHTQKLESLGVLAGGIAHDFNNILTTIIGNADLALMRLKPESPVLDNLERIEQAAVRAADLARQMLAYSGKGKFVVESLNLNILLEEMLHMLEVSISKKVVLRINNYPSLPSVVDDEETVRGIGTEMLRELGYTTLVAGDGREALTVFIENPNIDFVILDMTMPNMDGEQCFRELRRLRPDIRVIISSGYNEQEVTQKFCGKGLAGFIQKPYKLSLLIEVIKGMN